ncbi:MAG: DUF87 domain-containing protein [Candidatus Atribacteria bacterium]|nr:DUF87 domain-containing protein [Candidatus Atribacteria bacterium]
MENNISLYEKLGLFYLGKEVDPRTFKITDNLFLYKSKDFTTHAAIIGMTGSGKTGLGIAIIEEATIDRIPSIIIDPKGDMSNLLLAFPDLKPEDFREWIDPVEAENKGMEPNAYAEEVARNWEAGLKNFQQDKERVSLYKNSADFTIYTPGSSAGIPLSVLSNFEAPPEDVMNDPDTYSAVINSTVTGLLSLINVKVDALTSKEYILIAALFSYFWKKNMNLTLEELIGYITNPPFEKIGVLSLNSFYPQKERFELAMLLNNILSSPGFAMWLEGERLDIQNLLYNEEGKPRVSILSLSHLDYNQQMFFVTLFLNKYISWMRQQTGTPSLRTLLYMDEIFGFFPATSNPPSKQPMLILLKQARAYGVGVVLATQNPIDLDYKGLANIGSWFLGRLQTRQDREKVVDGMAKNVEGAMNKSEIENLLANMKKRTFLLKSAHLDSLPLLETRWVLSYLIGPLSVMEIKKLMEKKQAMVAPQQEEVVEVEIGVKSDESTVSGTKPFLSDKIKQYFLHHPPFREDVIYQPRIIFSGKVRFYNESKRIDHKEEISLKIPVYKDNIDLNFNEALPNDDDINSYDLKPLEQARFALLPPFIEKMKDMSALEEKFKNYVYDTSRIELYHCRELKLLSRPGEELSDYKSRMLDLIRAEKDKAVEKLTEQYTKKGEKLEKEFIRLQQKLGKEEADVKTASTDSALSLGSSVIGVLLGRSKVGTLNTGVTGLKRASRVLKEKKDVEQVKKKIELLSKSIQELEEELKQNIENLSSQFDIDHYTIETISIKPKKGDIFGISAALLWESR